MDTPDSATPSAARLTAAAGADTFAPTPRIPAFDFVTAPATNILDGVAVVFSGTDFARFTADFLRQAIERHGGVVVDHVTASGSVLPSCVCCFLLACLLADFLGSFPLKLYIPPPLSRFIHRSTRLGSF